MGSAKYVGRVGALAVALGIGTALVTSPGIAWADETGGSDTNNNATDGGDTPGGANAGGTTGNGTGAGTGTGTGDAPQSHVGNSPTGNGDGNGNGGHVSTGASSGTTTISVGDGPTVSINAQTTTTGTTTTTTTSSTATANGSTTAPTASAPTSSAPTSSVPTVVVDPSTVAPTPTVAAPIVPAVVDPTSVAPTTGAAVPPAGGAPGINPILDPNPGAGAGQGSTNPTTVGGAGLVQDLTATGGMETGAGQTASRLARSLNLGGPNVAAAVVDPTAPYVLPTAPTVSTPPVNPIAALIALPGNIVSFAVDLIAAALTPFLTGVPSAPADTPVLWAVLAFVRRQFFNSSPTLAPTSQVANPTTGQLYGTLGATDADGDPLTYEVLQGPAHGAVVVNAAGQYVYQPTAGYVGADSFTVAVSDGGAHVHGLTGLASPYGPHATVATIGLTAVPVITDTPNSAPTIGATPGSTDPVTGAIRYTVTTTDPDGDPVAVTYSTPVNGTITPDTTTTGVYVYTPDADYAHQLALGGSTTPGSDTITFTATDPDGATDTIVVTASIAPVNTAPSVILNVVDTGAGDGTKYVTVTVTDADGDDVGIAFADLEHGSFTGVPNGTTAVLAPGQTITLLYTPDPTQPGAETITFTAADAYGGINAASSSINVDGTVNQNPTGTVTASDPDANGAVLVSVTFSDPEGDAVTVFYPQPDTGTLTYLEDQDTYDEETGEFTQYYVYQPYAQSRVDAFNTDGDDVETLDFFVSDTDDEDDSTTVSVGVTISPAAVGYVALDDLFPDRDGINVGHLVVNPNDGHTYASVLAFSNGGDGVGTLAVSIVDVTSHVVIAEDVYSIAADGGFGSPNDPRFVALVGAIYGVGNFVVVGDDIYVAAPTSIIVVHPDGTTNSTALQGTPLNFAVSPDGTKIIADIFTFSVNPDDPTGVQTATRTVIDVTTGTQIGYARAPFGAVADSILLSDTAVTNDGTVYIVEATGSNSRQYSSTVTVITADGQSSTTNLDGLAYGTAITSDGAHVYTTVTRLTDGESPEYIVDVLDLTTGRSFEVPVRAERDDSILTQIAASPDGTQIALFDGRTVVFLDPSTESVIGTTDTTRYQTFAVGMSFSADGRSVVLSGLGTNGVTIVAPQSGPMQV